MPVYVSGVSGKVEWRCKMALLPGGMSCSEEEAIGQLPVVIHLQSASVVRREPAQESRDRVK